MLKTGLAIITATGMAYLVIDAFKRKRKRKSTNRYYTEDNNHLCI